MVQRRRVSADLYAGRAKR
ncbi:hypothetical protein B4U79_07968 [Dinothrombium tinctorium]|uniref:Uncharacterized protein n=1 Tax=Dinothrombium tinctorium TaxID=1965070 RepID=A0A443RDB5_9ACAR|nr:hypothetical protein B4U79_07968 [Dinothrombium tinctorium]